MVSKRKKKGKPGRKPKYPWEEWFKRGEITILVQGVDFDGYTRSFIGSIYRAASNYGATVRVKQTGNERIVLTCLN